ncbi:MAG: arylsulfatase A [Candidatus Methanocomedens sp.]|nr:MAG: arylsulfatase A [ANME-2 cluster archaeon]
MTGKKVDTLKISAMRCTITIIIYIISVCYAIADLSAQQQRPNIVLIMADDLGYECLGVNGGTSYHTPVLDRLAEKGIRFEHCHSLPQCTPSRVQLMTGIYNINNYTKFGVLDRSQTTFIQLLKNAGYKTCIAGKWQLGKELDSPEHFGFNEYCLWQHTLRRTDEQKHDTRFSNPLLEINGTAVRYTNGEYGPDVVSDFLCDFIEKNKDESFLAYYPMILTHCPFTPTPDSEDWDPGDMGSLKYKGDPVYFGDMVSYMDKIVGKIITKLEELDLRENTLILFTGDNGTDQPIISILDGKEIPGGKYFTSDNGTHVPLIANWNGVIQEGQVCNDLVDFSDFFPTICELTGIEIPGELAIDGKSFLPQLYGKNGIPHNWIHGWYTPPGKNLKEWARDKHYKLYRTGEFYHVEEDFLEEYPLKTDQLSSMEKIIHQKLTKVLNQYENVRSQTP